MPRHALSAEEFAAYAREQISTADAVLTRHRQVGRACCQCGRPLPCSQAEAVRARKDHYLVRLGLAEATVPMPVVSSGSPVRPRGLRALLSRFTRHDH